MAAKTNFAKVGKPVLFEFFCEEGPYPVAIRRPFL